MGDDGWTASDAEDGWEELPETGGDDATMYGCWCDGKNGVVGESINADDDFE